MPQIGQLLQGRYRIESLISVGGMGAVYKAKHLQLGKFVAVKTLRSLSTETSVQAKFRAQFEFEARTLARLSHPNLVAVHDYFTEGSEQFLVMDLIEGQTLTALVQAGAYRDEASVLQVAFVLLEVLGYLHSQSPPVILRDLKPDNVMVGNDGRIVVIDFGIAKLQVPGVDTYTVARGAASDGYAPLEQYGGRTDARSDLYSLGATLLFLLTGQAPPSAIDRATVQAPLTDPRSVNPTVSDATWQSLLSLMAISADQRPQSVYEIRQLLQAASQGSRPVAPVAGPTIHASAAPPTVAAQSQAGVYGQSAVNPSAAPRNGDTLVELQVEQVYQARRNHLGLIALSLLVCIGIVEALLLVATYHPQSFQPDLGAGREGEPGVLTVLSGLVGLSAWVWSVILTYQISSIVEPQNAVSSTLCYFIFPFYFVVHGSRTDQWLRDRGVKTGFLGPYGLEAWRAARRGRTVDDRSFDGLHFLIRLVVAGVLLGASVCLNVVTLSPAGIGTRVYFYAKNERVYYLPEATEDDAQHFANYLAGLKIFDGQHACDIRLSKQGLTFTVSIIVQEKFAQNSEKVSQLDGVRRDMSHDAFGDAPVVLLLCDNQFRVLKVLR